MAKKNSPTLASSLKMTRILIVDDHPIVRQGYAQLLSQQPDLEVCGEAATSAEAMRVAQEEKPDLALVDISLDDGSGVELVKRLLEQQPGLKALVVSAHEEMLFAERSLRAGAMGFINKKAAITNLVRAVRRVLDGDIYLSDRMNARLLRQISRNARPLETDPVERLTDRELEVFDLLGQGKSTREMADRLSIQPKTVDRHRERIKEKLNLANANELLRHATQWVLENR